MSPRWRRRLVVLLLLAAAFWLGATLQERLGLSFSLDGLQAFRDWVQDLGWWGPTVFILLAVFRLFIGLSSHLIFILGGLAFGVAGGILWGSLGLLASSLVLFYVARSLGADWAQRRFGDRYRSMETRIKRLGEVAIFAISAHPFGLLTPAHVAAGLVGLNGSRFAVAVALAAPIRTAPYAVLGTAVLDWSPARSLAIAGGLIAVFVLPLLSPTVRRWLWGGAADASGSPSNNDRSLLNDG